VTPKPLLESTGPSISLDEIPTPQLNSIKASYYDDFPSKYIVWTKPYRQPTATSKSDRSSPCEETADGKVDRQAPGLETNPTDDFNDVVENMVLSVVSQDGFLLDVNEGRRLTHPNLEGSPNP